MSHWLTWKHTEQELARGSFPIWIETGIGYDSISIQFSNANPLVRGRQQNVIEMVLQIAAHKVMVEIVDRR